MNDTCVPTEDVKVGDFVGWEDTWTDEDGCDMAGLVVGSHYVEGYFDVLLCESGKIAEVHKIEVVVMFEGR